MISKKQEKGSDQNSGHSSFRGEVISRRNFAPTPFLALSGAWSSLSEVFCSLPFHSKSCTSGLAQRSRCGENDGAAASNTFTFRNYGVDWFTIRSVCLDSFSGFAFVIGFRTMKALVWLRTALLYLCDDFYRRRILRYGSSNTQYGLGHVVVGTQRGNNNKLLDDPNEMARYAALWKECVNKYADLFNEMNDKHEVVAWFKQQYSDFFAEWPRGGTPLSQALSSVQKSRFAFELKDFVVEMDEHWHDPFKKPAPWETQATDPSK